MSRIRRILVAIKDPWRRSLPEVRKAAQLAHALGARVQLFHALSDPLYIDAAEAAGVSLVNLERSEHARVAKRLATMARRLERTGIRAESAVHWDFPAHEAVVRAARRFGADLIVAERHATPHHLAWLLRFTDFELLRLAPVPVLLVKMRRAYKHPAVLAAVDPSHAYAKPLKLDREILSCASQIAEALQGSLHTVFAYDPVPVAGMESGLPLGETMEAIAAAMEARARKLFASVLNGASVPESRRHLVPQHPIDAIEGAAAKIGCGIVVMGAISRSGLKRLVLGNTAERVFDDLRCDLLVVKPKRFASRVPLARRGPQLMTLPLVQPGY
ncbi:MAG TPA: universal stress protein [Steroidobacteraceae bacterium]|jgi:universal stress protein E|nr:universal stress protein [Steroidobacteraceae bacterium]